MAEVYGTDMPRRWLEAESAYTEAARCYAAAGQALAQAEALYAAGDAAMRGYNQAVALEHLAAAQQLFQLLADSPIRTPQAVAGEANVLKAIGDVQKFRDDRDAALESYAAALGLFRQVGARLGEANVLQAIGDVQKFRDDRDAALESYAAALGLYRQVGARLGEANVLQAQGFLQLDAGRDEAGLQALNSALGFYRQIGERVGQANIYWGLGLRLAQNGALTEAEPLLAEAVRLGNQIAPGNPVIAGWEQVLAQVRAGLQ
jgi:tetratricopeptide (TPR) repeat protein